MERGLSLRWGGLLSAALVAASVGCSRGSGTKEPGSTEPGAAAPSSAGPGDAKAGAPAVPGKSTTLATLPQEGEVGETVFAGWIFARFPDFGQGHGANPSPVTVVLKDFRADQFSVLEAAKDPGANFIWLGCLLVMAGLFLAFYWPPREIRVAVGGAPDKAEVTAGGHAAKGPEAFQAEFDEIFKHVRRPS